MNLKWEPNKRNWPITERGTLGSKRFDNNVYLLPHVRIQFFCFPHVLRSNILLNRLQKTGLSERLSVTMQRARDRIEIKGVAVKPNYGFCMKITPQACQIGSIAVDIPID